MSIPTAWPPASNIPSSCESEGARPCTRDACERIPCTKCAISSHRLSSEQGDDQAGWSDRPSRGDAAHACIVSSRFRRRSCSNHDINSARPVRNLAGCDPEPRDHSTDSSAGTINQRRASEISPQRCEPLEVAASAELRADQRTDSVPTESLGWRKVKLARTGWAAYVHRCGRA